MAEKSKSQESGDSRKTNRSGRAGDLEDDVTSELSDPFAWPIDDPVQGGSLIDPETDNVLKTGTRLNDRFEIIDLVHSGGMGHIYKAIDRRRHPQGSGQIHVAIKMLRESLADRDEFRMMLEREAAKAQSLSHPNIINIFDFDEHEGRFFLVMEWLEGESVRALLRRTRGQRLAPSFAWAVIEGAAAALHHAHLNDVVHADINPSNIFITKTLDIKLLDFGVARCASDAENPAAGGATWVTQTYASPEVLAGLPPVFQDDIFSLGCVAYRLLGGEHPFGESSSIAAKDRGVAVAPIPGMPGSEWNILVRALAYLRSERPDTVDVFLRNHHRTPAVDAGAGKPGWSAAILHWGPPIAAAVIAAIAVGWWLQPEVPATGPISEDVQNAPPAEALAKVDESPVEALLDAAKEAAEDQRLVIPEGDNARERYREVLIAEPENGEALRGLRWISDTYVERAGAALKSGDPQEAASALTIASETDADNPAIPMVSDLLIAQGDSHLAAARAAAATGDIEQANSALAQAERYAHIDSSAINAVRKQLAGLSLRNALNDGLAVVDGHISAGRLLEPSGNNARESLAALSFEYGGDPRLDAAYRRLAERLLTRAAVATAAGRAAEAEVFIDAADALGVLEAEVNVVRESMAKTAATADAEQEAMIADDSPDRPNPTAIADQPLMEASDATPVKSDSPPATESSEVKQDASARSASSLEDLGLEKFVAPSYPRRARRQGMSGYVKVAFDINPDGRTDAIEIVDGVNTETFDHSAVNAVRQWRFAPRPDTIRESVILSFEITD